MKTLYNQLTSRDNLSKVLVILLALIAIVTYIIPIFSLFSTFVELHRTYAYTEEEKTFLKYEDGYVYTTDNCKYQDKDGNFAKIVIEEQDLRIEEGNSVTVFTSSLTDEVIHVKVYSNDYPYYYASVNTIPKAEWGKYESKVSQTGYLQTACTFVILLTFFVAVAIAVIITKNTKRRNAYSLLYLIAIPALFLSYIANQDFTATGASYIIVLCLLILSSLAYGFIAHLLSRRIIFPSLIFVSSLALLSILGVTDTFSDQLIHIVDFLLIPFIVSVLGAWISRICFSWLKYVAKRQNKDVDTIKFFGKVFRPCQELDERSTGFMAQFAPIAAIFAVTVIPLFCQITWYKNDWGSLLYVFLLFIVYIIHGIFSFWQTKKIVLPNLIIILSLILIDMINYSVRFNSTPKQFLLYSLSQTNYFVIFSLPIPIIWFITCKIISFFKSCENSKSIT